MRRLLLPTLAASALYLATGGCKPKEPPPFDADARSGPDGKRVGARTLQPNTPISDSVNYEMQDQTDWYVVQLQGNPGILTCELEWSNDKSDIAVDVFDQGGNQLAASAPAPGAKHKTLLAKIDKVPDAYFIRVWAPNKTDATPYTLTAKWTLPEPPKPEEPPPPPPPEEPKPKKHHEEKPKIEREAHPKSSDTVQGRVVSAYLEGGGLKLQIDKGSAAGIQSGFKGQVLQGASGEDPLDGGDFTVVQVIGPNKCLAKTGLQSIGKNTRVVITLSK
jgi:hypothetical protein